MDAVSLLVQLVFKTFFLALPVGVAWLAFRRLMLSESHNAWLYAAVGLFSSIAALALAPWALGFAGLAWQALIVALVCPPIWMATVVFCDVRERTYGDEDAAEWLVEKFQSTRRQVAQNAPQSPLILKNPLPATASDPMFRTRRSALVAHRTPAPAPVVPLVRAPSPVAEVRRAPAARPNIDATLPKADEHRRVIDVARDMRGSLSDRAERKRERDLPFVPQGA